MPPEHAQNYASVPTAPRASNPDDRNYGEPKAEKSTLEAAQQHFAALKQAATPHVERLLQAATPHVERLLQTAMPYVQEVQKAAMPYVQEVQKAAMPYVQEVQKAAMPYVQEVQKAAMPYVQEVQKAAEPLMEILQGTAQHFVPGIGSEVNVGRDMVAPVLLYTALNIILPFSIMPYISLLFLSATYGSGYIKEPKGFSQLISRIKGDGAASELGSIGDVNSAQEDMNDDVDIDETTLVSTHEFTPGGDENDNEATDNLLKVTAARLLSLSFVHAARTSFTGAAIAAVVSIVTQTVVIANSEESAKRSINEIPPHDMGLTGYSM
jgi:hypothetical protein